MEGSSGFSPQVSQDPTPSTSNSGFFQWASNVNASHGVFNQIGRNQYITYNNAINVEMAENACLDKLPRAMAAGYTSEHHKSCLRGTRETVLQEIEMWEAGMENEFVYWLKGVAGCGKSTVTQTFAERSAAKGHLGASFFCSRDYPDRRNLRLIFPTLAYQLAFRYSAFKPVLARILLSNPDVWNDSLAVQLEKLLVLPLKQTKISTTIVIDALDECEDKEPVSALLSALARYVDDMPTVKFFITGRPEDHIRSGFMIPSLRTKELPLHDVNSVIVDSDIKSFVKTKLEEIARRRSLSIHGQWPLEKDITAILEKCSSLFIVASVIIGFIDDPFDTPQNRLKLLMDMPNSTIHEGESGIDATYKQVFAASFKDIVDKNGSQFFGQLRLVVGSIVLAFRPLSRASLAKVLEMAPEMIFHILSRLHSVLIVPESDSEAIRICHKSFADFITDRRRCTDARYHVDTPVHHLKLGTCCLTLMKAALVKNICRLPRYSLNKDIKDLPSRREEYIGPPLAYSCSSWAKHLYSSSKGGCNTSIPLELVKYFLENDFLSWLEVLSIEGNLGVAVYSLHDVRSLLSDIKNDATSLLELIDDCERFVLRFFDVMEQSTTHIYHSALAWSPMSSLTRHLYQRELLMEAKLLNAVDTIWGSCIRMIPVENSVHAVVFSHLGASIATSGGQSVKVFETITGVIQATFDTLASVYSTAFSPDDSLIVAGLENGVANIWDLQTGNLLQMLKGHTSIDHYDL